MYQAAPKRYETMKYRRVGNSGLKLPALSLGLWNNFGDNAQVENQKKLILGAFDRGITHFDLANNYGPPAGSAERNFGRIFKEELSNYRDELIVSSKAGFYMWEGPYGEWGSRKSIIASCDQSLMRCGLEYFDIFYHHRPDPDTPLEETALALDQLICAGKALYIGISNYEAEQTKKIGQIFKELKTPFIVNQSKYNLFERQIEEDVVPVLDEEKLGAIAYSPLAQGLLTNRYLNGIPADSRASQTDNPFLTEEKVTQTIEKVKQLNKLAQKRGQTLAQLSLAWNLRLPCISSVIIGASRMEQLEDNLRSLNQLHFSDEELKEIDQILS